MYQNSFSSVTYNPYVNDVWVNPTSISNWENSFFGGSEKVLRDYPDIEPNPNIIIKLPDVNYDDVPVGQEMKLINIFLKEYGDIVKISYEIDVNIVDIMGIECVNLTKRFLSEAIEQLYITNFEIGQLFKDYENYIKNTSILIPLPNKKQCDGNDSLPENKKSDIEKEFEKKLKSFQRKNDDTNISYDESEFKKIIGEFGKIKIDDNTNKKVESESVTNPELFKKTKFYKQIKLRHTEYGSFEKSMSNQLVRLLDINFQPKSDVISNLKSGKLDVRKLGEIPGGNTNVYSRKEENQSTRPFNVCILCDESGSMQGDSIIFQHKLIKVLYKTFSQILAPENIFIYGHSGECTPEIYVYNQPGNTNFDILIDNMLNIIYRKHKDPEYINRGNVNYDGPVIENVYNKVREFSNENILFIVLSDGQPNGEGYGSRKAIEELNQIIEKCRRDGFVTIGIGIGNCCEHIPEIYTYNHIIHIGNKEVDIVKSVSTLINKVVKLEFKD